MKTNNKKYQYLIESGAMKRSGRKFSKLKDTDYSSAKLIRFIDY